MKHWLTILLILTMTLTKGCMPPEYGHAISTLEDIPEISAFVKSFPDRIVNISYFSAPRSKSVQCSSLIFGRYECVLSVREVVFTSDFSTLTSYQNPKLILKEINSIELLKDGGANMNYGKNWKFDGTNLTQLINAKWDFIAVGVPIKTNTPVKGIDVYWGTRKKRAVY